MDDQELLEMDEAIHFLMNKIRDSMETSLLRAWLRLKEAREIIGETLRARQVEKKP